MRNFDLMGALLKHDPSYPEPYLTCPYFMVVESKKNSAPCNQT